MAKREITPTDALSKVAFACSTAEYCSYDIRIKLQRWGLNSNEISTIIDHLIDENYINDTRYAIAFSRDKYRFDGWGRIKIRYKLRTKQLSSEDITAALAAIDDNEYIERLQSIIDSKHRSISNRDYTSIEQRNAIYKYCISRGFEHEYISRELRNLKFENLEDLD
ncbi:MAG: regulatory protein RecX [Bacteroidales bacterium]